MKNVYKLIAAALVCMILLPAVTVSGASDPSADLLFVAVDQTTAEAILADSDIAQYTDTLQISVITADDFSIDGCENADAVAVPCDGLTSDSLTQLYQAGIRVYIYGDLTINDYMDYTGADDFTSSVPVYDVDEGFTGEYITRDFGEYQKRTKEYQIICNPLDDAKGLLCTFDKSGDGNQPASYMNVIAEDYAESLNRTRAAIVDSDYNIVSYFNSDNSSIHMSWILYRNYDEEDTDYDYFALESRVWVKNSSIWNVVEITGEHEKYYYSDSLIDYGPESSDKTSTVTFELGVSAEGPTGSVSYSYDLDSAPDIALDSTNYPDSVAWAVSKRTFGPSLQDDVLKFASSWAIASYHERARFTVSYGAQMGNFASTAQSESIEFLY